VGTFGSFDRKIAFHAGVAMVMSLALSSAVLRDTGFSEMFT